MKSESPLGKASPYSSTYDATLLFAIARAESRARLGLGTDLPFAGVDIWNAWELSWLNENGVPQIASAQFDVPADSPRLIESKSLKLYLGSFAMSQFSSPASVRSAICKDLAACAGSEVAVSLSMVDNLPIVQTLPGTCIDTVNARCDAYEVDASSLSASGKVVSETLHSHLLRSLCPVTGQPDIGSVLIRYLGAPIDHAGLLRYIVSFREHEDFHEACVERMFVDIQRHCQPAQLSVYARYQRRGGVDINPFRSNYESAPENPRLWRQ